MTIFTKIKIAAVILAVVALAGWAIYTVALRAERDNLARQLATAEFTTQEALDTLARERAAWQVATVAITSAAQAQGAACRADIERRVQIDDISREATAIERPKGSIDEQTSGKVIDMFNGSLFAPLGSRVRSEAN